MTTRLIRITWQATTAHEDARLEVELNTLADLLEAAGRYAEVTSHQQLSIDPDEHPVVTWVLYTEKAADVPDALFSWFDTATAVHR